MAATKKPVSKKSPAKKASAASAVRARGNQERYTVAQMIEALRQCEGLVATAARALGCDRETVYHYMQRHPEVAEAREEAREIILDVAESELAKAVRLGDLDAVKFTLSTVGKNRGYVTRQEQTGKDGGPQKHEHAVTDLAGLTPEELIRVYRETD